MLLEAISKTSASGFIGGKKHLETIKTLGRFIWFRTPDETLALVVDIP